MAGMIKKLIGSIEMFSWVLNRPYPFIFIGRRSEPVPRR
jgi:hypothetical protein